MASLTGQAISDSYEQLLTLPDNGGDGANLVAVTDGDGGTTFAIQLASNKVKVVGGFKCGSVSATADYNAHTIILSDGATAYEGGLLMTNSDTAGSGHSSIKFNATSSAGSGTADLHIGVVDNNATNTFIRQHMHLDGATGNVNFNSGGKVGIGTASPASTLHVLGNTEFGLNSDGQDVMFHGTATDHYMQWNEGSNTLRFTDNSYAKFGDSNDFQIHHKSSDNKTYLNVYAGTASVEFATNVDASGKPINIGYTTSEVTIGDNLTVTGDLGIGTGSPSAKLHVAGDMFLAGNLVIEKSVKTIASGILNVLSTDGPYVTVTSESSTTDNLDFIQIDGGTPPEGTMLYLTRTGGHTITVRTGLNSSVTDGVTAIQCNYADDVDEALQGIDEIVMNTGYGIMQLLYCDADRWIVMNPGNFRANT